MPSAARLAEPVPIEQAAGQYCGARPGGWCPDTRQAAEELEATRINAPNGLGRKAHRL